MAPEQVEAAPAWQASGIDVQFMAPGAATTPT